MKINNIENSTNFKQIKLSRIDALKAGRLILEHRKNLDLQKSHSQLIDIFMPYIDKEASLIDDAIYSVKDYKQDLCVSLIEKFDKLKEKNHPITALIQQLNKVRPHNNAKTSISDKLIEDFSEAEQIYLSNERVHEKSLIQKVDELISSTISLTRKEKDFLEEYLDCKTYQEIGDSFGMTREGARQILRKCIQKIKFKHNKKYRIEYEKLHSPKTEAE